MVAFGISTKDVHGQKPTSNAQYWNPKLKNNVLRDEKNILELEESGWRVFILWECQIKNLVKNPDLLAKMLETIDNKNF